MLTTNEFFDHAAGFYDEMIHFKDALVRRQEQMVKILPTEKIIIADLGSGSGLDAITAALAGHTVTCFDLSQNMLEQARRNGEENGVYLQIVQSDIARIDEAYHNKFDMVISTGNTLSLIDKETIDEVFSKMYSLLKSGGTAVVQLLNFEKILHAKERIVALTKKNEHYYLRSYDFHTSHIDFNILRFNGDAPAEREMITTKLFPHMSTELRAVAKAAGFTEIEIFGGLAKQDYKPEASNDICLILKKI